MVVYTRVRINISDFSIWNEACFLYSIYFSIIFFSPLPSLFLPANHRWGLMCPGLFLNLLHSTDWPWISEPPASPPNCWISGWMPSLLMNTVLGTELKGLHTLDGYFSSWAAVHLIQCIFSFEVGWAQDRGGKEWGDRLVQIVATQAGVGKSAIEWTWLITTTTQKCWPIGTGRDNVF